MEVKTIKSRVDVDDICLFETQKGSSVQGTFDASKGSDIDYCGIVWDPETALGERINKYADERNDVTYYDIDRFIELLLSGNPDVVEMISIDPKYHTLFPCRDLSWIFKNPELFYTRKMIKAGLGFIESQIKKSITKLNKKMESRISDFNNKKFTDFLSVKNSFLEGNTRLNIVDFVSKYNLKIEFIKRMELSKNDPNFEELIKRVKAVIPESDQIFEKVKYYNSISELYYSWKLAYEDDPDNTFNTFMKLFPGTHASDFYELVKLGDMPKAKIGLFNGNPMETGGNLIGSSAMGGFEEHFPIGILFYDGKGFETFCREKKDYEEWDRNKNVHRFLNNQGSQYDIKNASHAVRMLNMLIELAKSDHPIKLQVDRTGIDADYLKSIKYQTDDNRIPQETMMNIIQSKKDEFIELMTKNTWIPEEVDSDTVNRLNKSVRDLKVFRLRTLLS